MKNPNNIIQEAGFRLDDAAAREALSPRTIRTGRLEEGGSGEDVWFAFQSLSMLVGMVAVASYLFSV
jgi:hypothetical protein